VLPFNCVAIEFLRRRTKIDEFREAALGLVWPLRLRAASINGMAIQVVGRRLSMADERLAARREQSATRSAREASGRPWRLLAPNVVISLNWPIVRQAGGGADRAFSRRQLEHCVCVCLCSLSSAPESDLPTFFSF
jgi:hypothetical protein